jgi:hypothetical protein
VSQTVGEPVIERVRERSTVVESAEGPRGEQGERVQDASRH